MHTEKQLVRLTVRYTLENINWFLLETVIQKQEFFLKNCFLDFFLVPFIQTNSSLHKKHNANSIEETLWQISQQTILKS